MAKRGGTNLIIRYFLLRNLVLFLVNNQLEWSFPRMPRWDGGPHAIVIVVVLFAFTVVVDGGVCDDGDALLSPSSSRSSLPFSISLLLFVPPPSSCLFFLSHRKESHTKTEDKTFEGRTTNLFERKNSVKVCLLYQVLYKKGVLPLARKSDTPTNHKKRSVQKNKNKKRESISADRPSDLTYLWRPVKSKGAPGITG
jgi:hypothetical protein